MKNLVATLGKKIVDQSVKKEADNACAFIGYQPKMPDAVRKLKKEKK